jgi:hypothetical protein
MVRLELKFGSATPKLGVKIATLPGGTPWATRDTSADELLIMLTANFANAPAVIVAEDGSMLTMALLA